MSSVAAVRTKYRENPALLRPCVELQRQKHSRADEGGRGCVLSTLKVTKADGYAQPSLEGKKPFTLHVMAFAVANGRFPREGYHVSHLCHNATCFNPEHLCEELPKDNERRKGCPVEIDCPHEDCTLMIKLCQHTPPCKGRESAGKRYH